MTIVAVVAGLVFSAASSSTHEFFEHIINIGSNKKEQNLTNIGIDTKTEVAMPKKV